MLESKKEALLSELVAQLCAERNFAFPQVQGFDELWQHFRALVNTREPAPISPFWLEKQDELLSGLLAEGGISSLDDAAVSPLNPRIRLWLMLPTVRCWGAGSRDIFALTTLSILLLACSCALNARS